MKPRITIILERETYDILHDEARSQGLGLDVLINFIIDEWIKTNLQEDSDED